VTAMLHSHHSLSPAGFIQRAPSTGASHNPAGLYLRELEAIAREQEGELQPARMERQGKPTACLLEGGAGYRIRTRGPLITNQVLYQLS
jgi:hypothetical protein